MIGSVILWVFGAALLACAIIAFRGRGHLLMGAYWIATPAQRAAMRTPHNDRFVGLVFLGSACACVLLGISFWLDVAWLELVGLAVVLATLAYALASGIRGLVRNG